MHSVVEGGVENVLQNAQAAAEFGMNPELVHHVELCMYPQLRNGRTDSESTRVQVKARRRKGY